MIVILGIFLKFLTTLSQPTLARTPASVQIEKMPSTKCICGVPAREIPTSGGQKLFRCGTEKNYTKDQLVLGCNFFTYKAGLKHVKKTWGLDINQFPKCDHELIPTLRVSKSCKHPNRVFFACPVEAPNR